MKTTPALVTLAALLGMVARTSAAAVSKEDRATMIKKILKGVLFLGRVGNHACSRICGEAIGCAIDGDITFCDSTGKTSNKDACSAYGVANAGRPTTWCE